ncbi:hypothetical protein GGD83_003635 [Rhodoblastus sphagnicola]|uniref:hypothetical protein n=1 Tax=Rhodoblastus sphagnicola TaxID=333368 RepID=UPI00130483F3|nr:hypothetical protein [Rhodoblastus sphagnicola]MBB4199811.1 hypothetical protein [Rhodoblastus sphagnicola]
MLTGCAITIPLDRAPEAQATPSASSKCEGEPGDAAPTDSRATATEPGAACAKGSRDG